MKITATITLGSIEQTGPKGGWCSGTATLTIDPADGGDSITLAVDSGGWVGYGAAIPESLHETASAAGHLGGYGSMSDWQISLDDHTDWHAGRHGAALVLAMLTEEQRARLPEDDDELEAAIDDAIMEAEIDSASLNESEQAWLREAILATVCPRSYSSGRADVERALATIDLPNGSGAKDIDVDEVRQALVDAGHASPIGGVDWTEISYVQCCYGQDGDDPGDCRARWGSDTLGLWWVEDGDEAVTADRSGPYLTAEEAESAAEAYAEDNREPGSEGDADADAYSTRLGEEAEGRAISDGEWIVLWRDGAGDQYPEPGRSYADRGDADREINSWYGNVYARTPGAMVHLMTHPVLGRRVDGEVEVVDVEMAS